jgi:hypothetical protein
MRALCCRFLATAAVAVSACSTPCGARRQRAVKGCSRATLRVRDKGAESDKMEVILQSGCWRAQHDIDQYSRRAHTYTLREKNIHSLGLRRWRGSARMLLLYTHGKCCCTALGAERNRERESEGLGVCVIYFTLWRPHKDVAQPTAKILQAAAAVARRRLRNLNCAPYIISPNRTHTHIQRVVGTKKLGAHRIHTHRQTSSQWICWAKRIFCVGYKFLWSDNTSEREREKTRSIIYKTCVYARRWKCSGGRINDGRKIDVSPFA